MQTPDHGFRQIMIEKSSEELVQIVESKRNEFQEEALNDAEAILTERGVSFQVPVIEEPEEPKYEGKLNHDAGPLIAGILMVLLSFLKPYAYYGSADDVVWVNITLNVVFRAIVISWSYNLCEKYRMKKTRWIILGLIFGGWELIAINFAVWGKQTPVEELVSQEEEISGDDQIAEEPFNVNN
jgi:hypothetical protein